MWQPWEYENPPMLLGVEYRTTERFMGKPVYAKVVNGGAYVQGGSFTFGSTNVRQVIRFHGYIGLVAIPWVIGNKLDDDYSNYTCVYGDNGDVRVKMLGGSQGYGEVVVAAYYTKTTDD
jgi:hypothetical protein